MNRPLYVCINDDYGFRPQVRGLNCQESGKPSVVKESTHEWASDFNYVRVNIEL